jgi:psp operon transcriptional activator
MASELGHDDWVGFGPAASDALMEYRWPGNVRELRNVVERAVYRWERAGPIDSIEIDPFHSPFRPSTQKTGHQSTQKPGQTPNQPSSSGADAAPDPKQRELPDDDSPVVACEEGPSDFKSRVARFERELLARTLADHRFNQRATAEALGLSYDQLRHALRRHDLIGAVA